MRKLSWRVIYSELDGNTIMPSKNNPKKSGIYLCTCIIKNTVKEHRYLWMMEYNADKKYWHDVGKENAISHTILAWTDVDMCLANDFELSHGYIMKR